MLYDLGLFKKSSEYRFSLFQQFHGFFKCLPMLLAMSRCHLNIQQLSYSDPNQLVNGLGDSTLRP
jgi:hypothetical protein